MDQKILTALEKMEKRGFKTHAFETSAELKEYLLQNIPADKSIGFGGSVTVTLELDLYHLFEAQGNPVYYHGFQNTPEAREDAIQHAFRSDLYMMSSNAVTYDGKLLNVDGNGNRVACMIYGPKTVYIIVGKNKFVDGDEAAIERVKTIATPMNARRLNREVPCAVTNKCSDCRAPHRLCNHTVWTENVRGNRTYHICVVNEDLGY